MVKTSKNDILLTYTGVGINFESAPSPNFASVRDLGSKLDRSYFLIKFFDEYFKGFKYLSTKEGRRVLLNEVTEYWMHNDQVVKVKGDKGEFEGIVKGLSDSGFLEVHTDQGIYEVRFLSFISRYIQITTL